MDYELGYQLAKWNYMIHVRAFGTDNGVGQGAPDIHAFCECVALVSQNLIDYRMSTRFDEFSIRVGGVDAFSVRNWCLIAAVVDYHEFSSTSAPRCVQVYSDVL